MEDVKILDEIATIKAIAHPLRIRIIEEFGGKAYTAKQIADKMKESPAKIYYHIIEMEAVGILRLVRTVENSGILEKYYEPVARYFKISKELLSNDKELSLLIVLVHSLNSNREEISVYKIQHMRNSGIDCEIRRNDGKLLDK